MINEQGGNHNTNVAHISGEVRDAIALNHKTYGEAFYTFVMGICRNSGYEDQVIVMVSERLLRSMEMEIVPGMCLDVQGQVRTYNEDVDGHNRLNIVVFAREIEVAADYEPINDIRLEGFLCKKPQARTSPLGRKICDLMLAVNRMYNKSDYIPCIAWGRNAGYSATLDVGSRIAICGRLQSRQYKKRQEDGQILLKTAYEVSVLQLETFEEDVI